LFERRFIVRGTTKFVLMALVALLTLQFFALTTPSAVEHDIQVAAASGIADSGAEEAAQFEWEYATCDPPDHAYPNGLPRTRDRHRTTADLTPQPVSHSPLTCARGGRTPADASLLWESTRRIGSSAAHSPAVLQVFLI
jgi:hypothetical protein